MIFAYINLKTTWQMHTWADPALLTPPFLKHLAHLPGVHAVWGDPATGDFHIIAASGAQPLPALDPVDGAHARWVADCAQRRAAHPDGCPICGREWPIINVTSACGDDLWYDVRECEVCGEIVDEAHPMTYDDETGEFKAA